MTPHGVTRPLGVPPRSLTYPPKDLNLCRQLNLPTFLTCPTPPPPPPQPNAARKRKRQGRGGERSSQAMHFERGRTRLMWLRWKRRVFTGQESLPTTPSHSASTVLQEESVSSNSDDFKVTSGDC